MASLIHSARRVAVAATKRAFAAQQTARAMSSINDKEGYIPDVDGLTGRARAEAVTKRAYGQDLFNRDALIYLEEGTKENPIPIYSTEDSRIVGITLPDDSEVRWFHLYKNELVYDPDTCNYFALKQVSQEEVDASIKRADELVVGKK